MLASPWLTFVLQTTWTSWTCRVKQNMSAISSISHTHTCTVALYAPPHISHTHVQCPPPPHYPTHTHNVVLPTSSIILHCCEWWTHGASHASRTNLNIQIARKGYETGGWGSTLQRRFGNESRLHLRGGGGVWGGAHSADLLPLLYPWPVIDWLNRHNDYAFSDYTAVLFTTGTDRGGIEGSFSFFYSWWYRGARRRQSATSANAWRRAVMQHAVMRLCNLFLLLLLFLMFFYLL